MKILTAVASKYGSTQEIAEAIAQELAEAGHTVDVRQVEKVSPASLPAYDALVLGSAVYMGNWMAEARQFVEENEAQLAQMPVWLFSSGPLGEEPPADMGSPANLEALLQKTGARDHQVFVGKLQNSNLSLAERLVAKVVKAPEGDFRDWQAIRDWAHEIAIALEVQPVAAR